MRLLAAIPLLTALAAFGDEASSSRPETSSQQPVAATPYRFEVVSGDPGEQGERLSAVLGCIGCHTLDLTGEDWTEPELGVLWTANLTQSAVVYSEEELTTMISEGKRPDRALMDMPSYLFSELHPDDIAALVSYLKTLPAKGVVHPDPTIGPTLAKQIESGYFKDSVQQVAEMKDKAPPDLGPEHAYARFILRATCAECHGMDLQGSTEPLMDAPPRPGLQIVAAYSAEDFSTLMKTGKPIGDRELKLMGGVSRWRYSRFTDSEIEAVYDYLLALARRGP
ncbi:MAG: cytochrome c [Woeseiaceae bacterium]|nr:cytochrome c [Woeseiaceae bacterium]